jgi:hypothetical protein
VGHYRTPVISDVPRTAGIPRTPGTRGGGRGRWRRDGSYEAGPPPAVGAGDRAVTPPRPLRTACPNPARPAGRRRAGTGRSDRAGAGGGGQGRTGQRHTTARARPAKLERRGGAPPRFCLPGASALIRFSPCNAVCTRYADPVTSPPPAPRTVIFISLPFLVLLLPPVKSIFKYACAVHNGGSQTTRLPR